MTKKSKRTLATFCSMVILAITALFFEDIELPSQTVITPTSSAVKVHFIDVGQGDAILIESDEQYLLIDAGENNQGEVVVDYLHSQGVETLDFVIGTHPHSDHIGGLDTVLNEFDVHKVILPDVIHTTKTFEDVLDAIEQKDLKITKAVAGHEYPFGDASFLIVAPNNSKYSDLNNYSVGVKFNYGSTSFLMVGDAEELSEKEMIDGPYPLAADVLKLSHHGSSTSNSEDFLDVVHPSFAVVSAGEDNSYGHPHREVLQSMLDRNIPLYRTDLQGTIIFTSDGNTISTNMEPYTKTLKP